MVLQLLLPVMYVSNTSIATCPSDVTYAMIVNCYHRKLQALALELDVPTGTLKSRLNENT